jgi:hypothetical protein
VCSGCRCSRGRTTDSQRCRRLRRRRCPSFIQAPSWPRWRAADIPGCAPYRRGYLVPIRPRTQEALLHFRPKAQVTLIAGLFAVSCWCASLSDVAVASALDTGLTPTVQVERRVSGRVNLDESTPQPVDASPRAADALATCDAHVWLEPAPSEPIPSRPPLLVAPKNGPPPVHC